MHCQTIRAVFNFAETVNLQKIQGAYSTGNDPEALG